MLDGDERYIAKQRLVRLLYERKWDKQRVIDLFRVVDWLMQLPEWLNSQVWQELETIEESKKVQYITSVERIGMARGMATGMAKGVEKGRVEGASRLLKRQLERRFGVLPSWATEKLSHASEQDLEAWGDAVLTEPTIELLFKRTTTDH